MRGIKILIFALSLFAGWNISSSQDLNISFMCDSLPFPEFVSKLDEIVPLEFHYLNEWVDSIYISLEKDDSPLKEILSEALTGTGLTYIVYNGMVIFSQEYTIKTDFNRDVRSAYSSFEKFRQSERVIYKSPEQDGDENIQVNLEYQLHRIGNPSLRNIGNEAVLSGYILDAETGEPLVGAVIYIKSLNIGAASNDYGFYSMRLPKGPNTLEYRFVGMRTTSRNIQLFSDGRLNIEMDEDIVSLKEVTVSTEGQQNVRSASMGMEKISIRQIREIPTALGEADIIKSIILLPGVQTVGEGAAGFNVRGGSTDQNLILMDRAPIINTSHFIGFFSAINADIMKDATLYKSSVPAHFGGRISSVLDLQTREGNKKQLSGSGGISPVMGKLMLEGPLVIDKSSFIVGVRSSYSNWVLRLLNDERLNKSSVFFADINAKMSFDLDDRNSLYASSYFSRDNFDYYGETGYDYRNYTGTLTWKNILSNRLFSLYSLVYSGYEYETISKSNSTSASSLGFSIGQYKGDIEYTWFPGYNHKLRFGMNSIWYSMDQGTLSPYGDQSLIRPLQLQKENGLETSLFISSDYDITRWLNISAGLRLSSLLVFGPRAIYSYEDRDNRSLKTLTDTTEYANGEIIASYINPEPRISLRISLDENTSIKVGYTRMAQYLHMLSNTTAISPTDTWKLSDRYLMPQLGDQYGVGFYRNYLENTIETSAEIYYRDLRNIIDYPGGAVLLMNEHLETDVLNGRGKAYGAEFLVKKTRGKLTGWMSYSYSRIFHKIEHPNPEKQVNQGDFFPANYDKPNSFSMVGNYKISRRVSFSSTLDYSDGRPITYPLASFYYLGAERLQYAERNEYRLPYYFRWDLSLMVEGNLRVNKLAHSSISFSVYNVTGRENAYSVFFRTEKSSVKGYQLSIYDRAIPTLTYNFKF